MILSLFSHLIIFCYRGATANKNKIKMGAYLGLLPLRGDCHDFATFNTESICRTQCGAVVQVRLRMLCAGRGLAETALCRKHVIALTAGRMADTPQVRVQYRHPLNMCPYTKKHGNRVSAKGDRGGPWTPPIFFPEKPGFLQGFGGDHGPPQEKWGFGGCR